MNWVEVVKNLSTLNVKCTKKYNNINMLLNDNDSPLTLRNSSSGIFCGSGGRISIVPYMIVEFRRIYRSRIMFFRSVQSFKSLCNPVINILAAATNGSK